MKANKKLYDKLKADRPSVVRMTLFSMLLRVVFFVLATVCIILGVSLFISETAGEELLGLVTGSGEASGMSDEDRHIILFLAFVFIVLGLLFALVSYLSGRLVRRGAYIAELEMLLDDEMDRQEIKDEEND